MNNSENMNWQQGYSQNPSMQNPQMAQQNSMSQPPVVDYEEQKAIEEVKQEKAKLLNLVASKLKVDVELAKKMMLMLIIGIGGLLASLVFFTHVGSNLEITTSYGTQLEDGNRTISIGIILLLFIVIVMVCREFFPKLQREVIFQGLIFTSGACFVTGLIDAVTLFYNGSKYSQTLMENIISGVFVIIGYIGFGAVLMLLAILVNKMYTVDANGNPSSRSFYNKAKILGYIGTGLISCVVISNFCDLIFVVGIKAIGLSSTGVAVLTSLLALFASIALPIAFYFFMQYIITAKAKKSGYIAIIVGTCSVIFTELSILIYVSLSIMARFFASPIGITNILCIIPLIASSLAPLFFTVKLDKIRNPRPVQYQGNNVGQGQRMPGNFSHQSDAIQFPNQSAYQVHSKEVNQPVQHYNQPVAQYQAVAQYQDNQTVGQVQENQDFSNPQENSAAN